MFWFKKKKDNVDEIIKKVNKKDLVKRYLILAMGCFISAFAFNLFFLKYGIVCFGISGLSIVLNEYGIDPNLFIFIASVVLLLISFLVLGFEKTKNSIIGSLLFPLLVYVTEFITRGIDLGNIEMLLIAIFGAVLSGIGYGMIFKTGFTTGGTDIINQIVSKYFKTSIGSSMLVVDGLVVLSGKLVFGWDIVMYGIIILYLISLLTDKVILGISQSKAFYVVTDKEEEVCEFLLSLSSCGVTIMDAKGGYSNAKQSMLLCVIPTKQYYIVKEGLKEIDKDIFFLVTDAYEVSEKEKNNALI